MKHFRYTAYILILSFLVSILNIGFWGTGSAYASAPSITTSSASSISESSATLNGNISSNGGRDITYYGFKWGTSSSSLSHKAGEGYSDYQGSITADLSGLSAGTKYYFQAFAQNADGTTYGPVKSFTTDAPEPEVTITKPSVTTQSASSISTSEATINGNITDNGNDTISYYGFKWGTSSSSLSQKAGEGYDDTLGSFSGDLSGLSAGTTYYYQAFAKNSAGTTYGSVKSFTTDAPEPEITITKPSVTTQSASSISTSGASLNGNITDNGNDTITYYGFKWGTSSSSLTQKAGEGYDDALGSFSGDLSGLSAGTTYYYQAFAKNSAGTTYGSVKSFTTDAPEPEITITKPSVTTLSASSISTSEATLNGSITDNGNGTITYYGFKWGTSSSSLTQKAGEGYNDGLGSFSGDLSGLSAGATYYYQAFAQNSAGTTYGSVKSFTTSGATVTKPSVTTGSADSISTSGATLNGSITDNGDGTITYYGIKWGTSSSSLGQKTGEGYDDVLGSFDGPVSGLSAGTTYYYQAFAQNSAGTSYGSVKSFTTSGATTTKPSVTTGSADSISASGATLNGSITDNGDGTITYYGIKWGTSSTSLGQKTGEGYDDTLGSFNGPVSGLSAGTTYYYQAFAQNSAGTSYGSVKSFTTSGATTTKPSVTTGSADSISASGATLNGSITDNGDGTITYYGIKWGTSSSSLTQKTGEGYNNHSGSFDGSVSGLSAATTYYYQAFAQNSAGTAYGEIKNFVTTGATVNKPTVTTGNASATASGESLNGSIDNNGNGTITYYGIKWGTSSSSLNNKTGEGYNNAIGSFSGTASSLVSGTTYYYQAFAQNSAGVSYGAVKSFIYGTSTSAPTVTSVTVNGGQPVVKGQNSNLVPVEYTGTYGAGFKEASWYVVKNGTAYLKQTVTSASSKFNPWDVVYTEPMTYQVKVVITDINGKTGEKSVSVTVSNPAADGVPAVTGVTVNGGQPVVKGQNNNLVPIEYAGTYGAGFKEASWYVVKNGTAYLKQTVTSSSARFNPWDVSYTEPMTYQVKVVITDMNGKTGEKSVSVTVSNPAAGGVPVVTSVTVNGGQPVVKGQNNNLVPIEYAGNYGAGFKEASWYVVKNGTAYLKQTVTSSSAKFNPWDVSYTEPMTYQVKVVITDINGKTGEKSVSVTVSTPASVGVPSVTSVTVNGEQPVVKGQNNNLVPIEYTGTYGAGFKEASWYVVKNGTSYLKQTVTASSAKFNPWDVSYTEPMTYQVKVIITDINGKTGEKSVSVAVSNSAAVGVPAVTSVTVNGGQPVVKGQNNNLVPIEYTGTYGAGFKEASWYVVKNGTAYLKQTVTSSSVKFNPWNITYTDPMKYQIKVILTDINGNTGEKSLSVTVSETNSNQASNVPILQFGSFGDEVLVLQAFLWNGKAKDPYGQYGYQTQLAVEIWQENYNRNHPNDKIKVDGEVGPQTWGAMGFLDGSGNFNKKTDPYLRYLTLATSWQKTANIDYTDKELMEVLKKVRDAMESEKINQILISNVDEKVKSAQMSKYIYDVTGFSLSSIEKMVTLKKIDFNLYYGDLVNDRLAADGDIAKMLRLDELGVKAGKELDSLEGLEKNLKMLNEGFLVFETGKTAYSTIDKVIKGNQDFNDELLSCAKILTQVVAPEAGLAYAAEDAFFDSLNASFDYSQNIENQLSQLNYIITTNRTKKIVAMKSELYLYTVKGNNGSVLLEKDLQELSQDAIKARSAIQTAIDKVDKNHRYKDGLTVILLGEMLAGVENPTYGASYQMLLKTYQEFGSPDYNTTNRNFINRGYTDGLKDREYFKKLEAILKTNN